MERRLRFLAMNALMVSGLAFSKPVVKACTGRESSGPWTSSSGVFWMMKGVSGADLGRVT